MMTAEQFYRKPTFERKVSVERAELAMTRLINSHFRSDSNIRPHARMTIPANQDDDDLVLSDFIAQTAAQLAEKEREMAELRQANASAGLHAIRYQGLANAAEQRLQEAQALNKRQMEAQLAMAESLRQWEAELEQLTQTLDACGKHAEQAEHDAQHAEAIVKKASAYCTICDDWRGDDTDGATSLRRAAFMELAEAVHATREDAGRE